MLAAMNTKPIKYPKFPDPTESVCQVSTESSWRGPHIWGSCCCNLLLQVPSHVQGPSPEMMEKSNHEWMEIICLTIREH